MNSRLSAFALRLKETRSMQVRAYWSHFQLVRYSLQLMDFFAPRFILPLTGNRERAGSTSSVSSSASSLLFNTPSTPGPFIAPAAPGMMSSDDGSSPARSVLFRNNPLFEIAVAQTVQQTIDIAVAQMTKNHEATMAGTREVLTQLGNKIESAFERLIQLLIMLSGQRRRAAPSPHLPELI